MNAGHRSRIVSLIASATEIVAALGFEEELVGRSHECDFPPAVLRLPPCSSSRVDTQMPSLGIDTQVRDLVAEALSVYEVDGSLLDALAPTVIVTQAQCEVCAVTLQEVERAVRERVSSRPAIVSLSPLCLDDIWDDIRAVAAALAAEENGEELVTRLQARLDAIERRAATAQTAPTIACIEWIEPFMFAANWVPDLVRIAGGKMLMGQSGRHAGYFRLAELAAADPDVIAIMPCGFDIPRSTSEMAAVVRRPEWHCLRAVQAGRVYVTDGNQYFNRPGPRVVESAEILAELLHPELFDFGHEGRGWIPHQTPRRGGSAQHVDVWRA